MRGRGGPRGGGCARSCVRVRVRVRERVCDSCERWAPSRRGEMARFDAPVALRDLVLLLLLVLSNEFVDFSLDLVTIYYSGGLHRP